ncbi:5'-nucleotidase C-terminal domain-containing protein [bacterium]|nr:5'-nucleotidase C-terminal domain-containing protein [bacterium]
MLKFWCEGNSWRMEHEQIPITADTADDPKVAALIEEAAHVVDREMAVKVGELAAEFPTRGKSGEANPLGQWIAELMRLEAGADMGLQNVGGYRTSLNAGEVSRGDIFTLLPFDNRIVRLSFRGDVLQELFDYLAESFGGGRFAQTSGVSYRVEDGKARDILIGGAPLDPASDYKVATLDFLLGGGDGYTVLQKAHTIEILDAFPRDVMENWLRAGNVPSPSDFPPNVQSGDSHSGSSLDY